MGFELTISYHESLLITIRPLLFDLWKGNELNIYPVAPWSINAVEIKYRICHLIKQSTPSGWWRWNLAFKKVPQLIDLLYIAVYIVWVQIWLQRTSWCSKPANVYGRLYLGTDCITKVGKHQARPKLCDVNKHSSPKINQSAKWKGHRRRRVRCNEKSREHKSHIGGSITVWLVSSLTWLDSTDQENVLLFVCFI